MKALITGGSGFIGSHLVDTLIKKNNEVTVLDVWFNPEIRVHSYNPEFQLIEGNVLDSKLVAKAVSDVDAVYHLAGILGTSETVEEFDHIKVTEVNVIGTIRMLKASLAANVERFIFVSTPDVPWLNPYKITKHASEKYCQMYNREYGLHTIIPKLTNVYGPREQWKESPSHARFKYQKVVPTFVTKALLNKPLPIFGDGDQSSDYIYVSDVVDALVLASVRDVEGGTVIPIGSGVNVSVNFLAHKIIELTNSKSGVMHLPMRRGEVKTHIEVDTSMAEKALGFKAKISLDEGLARTIPYYAEKLSID